MVRRRRVASAVAAAAALCSADARRPAADRGRPAPTGPPSNKGAGKNRRRNRHTGKSKAKARRRSTVGPEMGASSHLTTAFSCGSVWTRANTCGILCPTGRDSSCPDGEVCYAGMDCGHSDRDLDDVMSEQRTMEQAELNRLAEERDGDGTTVDRFVCGTSYDDAALRCAAGADPPQLGARSRLGVPGDAHYCPSGTSGACPRGTECYAAVPCPSSTHAPEVPALATHGAGGGERDGRTAGAMTSWTAVRGVTEAVLVVPSENRTEDGAGGTYGGDDGFSLPGSGPTAGFWAAALSGLVGPC